MKKRVCVIGAGPSGLVVVKELLAKNLEVVCYEYQEDYGGAFRSTKNGGRSYDSLELTVSNYFMAYSDFLPKEEKRKYWSVAEYNEYLKAYVSHFNLENHLRLQHDVKKVSINGKQIIVSVENKISGSTVEESFDHIVVCTGSNFSPFTPKIKGMETFEGEIMHSSEYTNSSPFIGKKVVCVGLGESGADIVHEICQVTQCKSIVRNYPNVIPKIIKGDTSDAFTSSCFYAMKKNGIDFYMNFKAKYNLNYNPNLSPKNKVIQEWISNRKSFVGKFLTKNDVFIQDIVDRKLDILQGEIESISSQSITMSNSKTIDADVILFNTGYQTSFKNFSFGDDFLNPRALYKNMIHPKYKTLVSLVGWARPSQGGLPACSELQARYLAQLIVGEKKLPEGNDLKEIIENDAVYYANYFSESSDLKSLVNYVDFMQDLGALVGCKPNKIQANDLKLTSKLFFASHMPMLYRLNDEKLKKPIADKIKSLPNPYSKKRIITMLVIILFFRPWYKIRSLLAS